MDHSPGFLKIVNEAMPRIRELSLDQARARLADNPKAVLLDVREDAEWAAGHAAEARHLGKGVLERDIEKQYGVRALGATPEVVEEFFAISVERRITHPCVTAITETARNELFAPPVRSRARRVA
jgi:rhodanese-related sulfurtransferase